jgi:hypothetical protein
LIHFGKTLNFHTRTRKYLTVAGKIQSFKCVPISRPHLRPHLSTIRKFRIVQDEGGRSISREVDFYNLDAIIGVGYRVNSREATHFRIWATQTLREFIVKGFVLDDERLKQGKRFGKDYFDELLERIREIRASERRFYLKITDIYEQCSIDYNKEAEITQTFFKTVQNKLHWAITGKTAAEIGKNSGRRPAGNERSAKCEGARGNCGVRDNFGKACAELELGVPWGE